jgi:hypothetical protein
METIRKALLSDKHNPGYKKAGISQKKYRPGMGSEPKRPPYHENYTPLTGRRNNRQIRQWVGTAGVYEAELYIRHPPAFNVTWNEGAA